MSQRIEQGQPGDFDNLYIVVCTDFHQSMGPMLGQELADKVAKQLTKDSRCTFRSVPFESVVRQMPTLAEGDPRAQAGRGNTNEYTGGQYL